MLVSSVNICTPENLEFYQQFDYLRGNCSVQKDEKMTIREQAVSIILEKEDSKRHSVSCYLENIIQMRKTKRISEHSRLSDSAYDIDTMYELAEFKNEDFERVMLKALNGTTCDVVLLCSSGLKNMKDAELSAISDIVPDAITFAPGEIFGNNFGSSFMLNVAVAVSVLRNQAVPQEGLSNNKIKKILVNGYNDLGNIISGVVTCV